MADEKFSRGRPLRVLVVGGRAQSAQAFRRYVSAFEKFDVTVLARQPLELLDGEILAVVADYFSPPRELLRATDVVVNFVGVPVNTTDVQLRALNIEGPARLARIARTNGVEQFVHLSSLHIYGDTEFIGRATPEAPLSPYARSKQMGDIALLRELADDFKITILRTPMHYGCGAGKKLRLLATLITRLGWFPVPNRRVERSVVHLENLSAAIVFVIEHNIGGIQFVADPERLSIETLVGASVLKEGHSIRLLRLPEGLFLPLRFLAKGIYRRLYRNNVICEDALLKLSYPVRLKDGLKDFLR